MILIDNKSYKNNAMELLLKLSKQNNKSKLDNSVQIQNEWFSAGVVLVSGVGLITNSPTQSTYWIARDLDCSFRTANIGGGGSTNADHDKMNCLKLTLPC